MTADDNAGWGCPECGVEYDHKPPFDLGGVCGGCYEEAMGDDR